MNKKIESLNIRYSNSQFEKEELASADLMENFQKLAETELQCSAQCVVRSS